MRELVGYVALTDRCVFRFTGEDRVRYLNGQVTNDVRKARPDAAQYACVTSAKGKLDADVFLSPDPGGTSLWVDGPGELREELRGRLEKYIIADDVTVEDLTDQVKLWHGLGVAEPPAAGWKRRANRYGVEGWDLLGWSEEEVRALSGVPALDPALLDELRIAHGIALWGKELSPEVLPQEANLQDRAIDFQKGCYIGQEVISRIKSVGRVNRELWIFAGKTEAEESPEEGDGLWAGEEMVGRVTSVSTRRLFRRIIGLGYVKRGCAEPGTELTCRNEKVGRICRVELCLAPLPDLNLERT